MTVLLDTHCWLWWLAEPEKLTPESLSLLKDRANTILVSAVVSWEIAIKYSVGRLRLPESPDRFVPERLGRDGFPRSPSNTRMHSVQRHFPATTGTRSIAS